MSKINKKSIILGFPMLSLLAFSLLLLPVPASADGRNVYYVTGSYPIVDPSVKYNPQPSISSINPKSANQGENPKSITVAGSGFAPGSVVRINNGNRATTFIDANHLIAYPTPSDMNRTDGGFYVTVWTPEPGGGNSNAAYFTLNKAVAPANNTNTYGNTGGISYGYNNYNNNAAYNGYDSNTAGYDYGYNNYADPNQQNSGAFTATDLTTSAVYGSNSFLPSGIIQWILFGIVILLLIILARRIFGAKEAYYAAPLKHE